MGKAVLSVLVNNQGNNGSNTGGRGEHFLRRPNEFISLTSRGKETAGAPSTVMSTHQDADINSAAAMLSTLLPRHTAKQTLPSSSPIQRPYPAQENQEIVPVTNIMNNNTIEHEVLIENQPYRTTPLVLPHAKTIHHMGDINKKFYSTTPGQGGGQPYRNSALVMPAPRTIHEVGVGAGPYTPYRGPQYYTDKKVVEKAQPVYNSPLPLYSAETLADIPTIPTTPTQRHSDIESATQQMVLVTDAGSSNRDAEDTRVKDPVMRDSSINQSASFKKLMHSVMGHSEL